MLGKVQFGNSLTVGHGSGEYGYRQLVEQSRALQQIRRPSVGFDRHNLSSQRSRCEGKQSDVCSNVPYVHSRAHQFTSHGKQEGIDTRYVPSPVSQRRVGRNEQRSAGKFSRKAPP